MFYAKFLEILINILLLLLGTGAIWIIVAIFSTISKKFNSANQKEEVSEIQTEELDINSQNSLANGEIEEILSHLEKEKRAISLGYNNMSPTHKEATKARIKKIEEKIKDLRKVSVFLAE